MHEQPNNCFCSNCIQPALNRHSTGTQPGTSNYTLIARSSNYCYRLEAPIHHPYLQPLPPKKPHTKSSVLPRIYPGPTRPSFVRRHSLSYTLHDHRTPPISDLPRFPVAHQPPSQQRRRGAGTQQLASHGSARLSMHVVLGLESGDDFKHYVRVVPGFGAWRP